MESIGRPILLEYSGYDAESNLIDARLLGVSMYGLGRLYVSNYHFFLTGQIPAQLKNPDVRIAVGPPQIGSISYLVYMLLVHGRLAVYPELLWEMVDICVPQIIKAVIATRGGQQKIAEDAMNKLYDMAKENAEIAKRVLDVTEKMQKSHDLQMSRLHKLINKLSKNNAGPMKQMVAPIGKSVTKQTHFKNTEAEYPIDQPVADVIRSSEFLEVLETTTMKVKIQAVDKTNRTCKILSDDYGVPVKGMITDPALATPHSAYTTALDSGSEILITGKPVLKEGQIHSFYISDAKAYSDDC